MQHATVGILIGILSSPSFGAATDIKPAEAGEISVFQAIADELGVSSRASAFADALADSLPGLNSLALQVGAIGPAPTLTRIQHRYDGGIGRNASIRVGTDLSAFSTLIGSTVADQMFEDISTVERLVRIQSSPQQGVELNRADGTDQVLFEIPRRSTTAVSKIVNLPSHFYGSSVSAFGFTGFTGTGITGASAAAESSYKSDRSDRIRSLETAPLPHPAALAAVGLIGFVVLRRRR